MAVRLDSAQAGFAAAFQELVEARREETADVRDVVREIIVDVRARGDAALLELTARFDRIRLETTRLAPAELTAALDSAPSAEVEALRLAAARIEAFHARQLPEGLAWTDQQGVRLGLRWQAIDAVGLYVPGGTAAYPSSVLMNAVPARVAGCRRLVVTVPTPDGVIDPLVLAACAIAGVDEVYRVGGAQAIAALAYGTQSIAPVDKIVGPGNAYVAEAKRQVFGRVGIDMIAGPSEILIVADGAQNPEWIAADLLSQAEHDAKAQSILITDSATLADAVDLAVGRQLLLLERAKIARASWVDHGAIVTVGDLDQVPDLVDLLAPEHLELLVDEPLAYAARIRRAGAIFLGPWTPEVIGDYVGGPNHVLPTSRTARFASGLSVYDFMTRTTLLGCDERAFRALAPAAGILARAEGLEAHSEAVGKRLGSNR